MQKRFTEEQNINILRMQENGVATKEVIRQHNITEQTFYRWKSKYGGMDLSEAKRLKQLEDENRPLKQIVADLTLDNQPLKWAIQKTNSACPQKRNSIRASTGTYSQRKTRVQASWYQLDI